MICQMLPLSMDNDASCNSSCTSLICFSNFVTKNIWFFLIIVVYEGETASYCFTKHGKSGFTSVLVGFFTLHSWQQWIFSSWSCWLFYCLACNPRGATEEWAGAVPAIIIANVRNLDNNMGELGELIKTRGNTVSAVWCASWSIAVLWWDIDKQSFRGP